MEQSGPLKTPELCTLCMNGVDILTVRHILINCTGVFHWRNNYYHAISVKHLFENTPLSQILDFLRFINVYKEI